MPYLRVNLVALSLLVACFVGVTPSAAIGQVSIGQGMNAPVFALAVNGTDVYAGGYFTTAGGVSANGIAKWDGTTWAPLGC